MVEQIKKWQEDEMLVQVELTTGGFPEGRILSYDDKGIVLLIRDDEKKAIPYTAISSIRECICYDI